MDNLRYDLPDSYTECYVFTNRNDGDLFLSDIIDGTVTSFSLLNLLQNNSEYITRLTYYPIRLEPFIDLEHYIVVDGKIYIGNKIISSYSSARMTGIYPFVKIGEFSVSRKYNNFLDFSPHRRVRFHHPYFEPIELPLNLIYGRVIEYYMSIDVINNECTLYLTLKDNGLVIETRSAKLGIELSIGKTNKEEQTRNNVLLGMKALTGVSLASSGFGGGNPKLKTAGILSNTGMNLIQNNVDRLTGYTSGNGNRSVLPQPKNTYLTDEFPMNVQLPNPSLTGKPLNENKLLSSLIGYTVISEINFNPLGEPIYDDEISEIIDLLRTGVIL